VVFRINLSLIFFILWVNTLLGFQFPTVSIYDPLTIQAGNQNWMIDQKADGDIVVANELGLLVYNGAQFKLYHGSDPNAIRITDDRIYSGGYMELGYWTETPMGSFEYYSLLDKPGLDLIIDEQFWNIYPWMDGVIFQSLDRLIYFDEKNIRFTSIPVSNAVSKMFFAMDRVFFQDQALNLYYLDGLKPVLYFPADQLPKSHIINLFSTDYGLMIFSSRDGFYQLDKSGFVYWPVENRSLLEENEFYSATFLDNGGFALGSITKGLYLIDNRGRLIEHLTQANALSNNTVLTLFEDRSHNVWLGLDSGINAVHLESPFREYQDKVGQIGTVYASALHDDYLYLGTNQGLFFKRYDSSDDFVQVENTNGQVWTLFVYGNDLFCGHNLGTYLIREGKSEQVAQKFGTWKLTAFSTNKNWLIQGNYDGIHLLEKQNEKWTYLKEIDSMRQSFRQFALVDNFLYFFHTSAGLVRSEINETGELVGERDTIYQSSLEEQISLARIGDFLLFSSSDGLQYIQNDQDTLRSLGFDRDGRFTIKDEPGKLVSMDEDMLVFIQGSNLYFLHADQDSISMGDVILLDQAHFKTKSEYENISRLDSTTFLIGMTDGYLIMNQDRFHALPNEYYVEINAVSVERSNEFFQQVTLTHDEGFPFQQNSFTFGYNVNNKLKYLSVQYQYKLEGEQQDWSDWTANSLVSFYKLRPGPYSFKVRARVGDRQSVNTAQFRFWIREPWHLSRYALLVYFILFIFLMLLVNKLYQRVYRDRQIRLLEKAEKDMQYIKLKGEQELMKEKNERLRTEIEAKNKELAVTAMSMVKKNEFLIEIRDHLKDIEPTSKFKPDLVIRSINREIENEESWEMLKNAFENVDKDFIQQLLEKHPGLTPNDLKLCTYLRLNMNSKEIATLLNISVRSMETKRYRLRKKLGLSHDDNLVEYILAV
jgi:DNA-binding CsgD family transcriptional regulator